MNVVQIFCIFLQFGCDRFCVVFASLISIEGFVGSCYFWLLFVLVAILFVFSSELMGESTFWRCDTWRLPKMPNQTPEHEKRGVCKLTCNTCHRSYLGQTMQNIKLKFREHTRYIKHNEPQSAYALHILNCRHEYDSTSDTCHYWNTSTNHHSYYHVNRCTYNYSIITMNKILCFRSFTIVFICHVPPDTQSILPPEPDLTSLIPSCIPDGRAHR